MNPAHSKPPRSLRCPSKCPATGATHCDETVTFKWYADATRLRVHQRVHTGERPFECGECHRAFADQSAYRRHVKRHGHSRKKKRKPCCGLVDGRFASDQEL